MAYNWVWTVTLHTNKQTNHIPCCHGNHETIHHIYKLKEGSSRLDRDISYNYSTLNWATCFLLLIIIFTSINNLNLVMLLEVKQLGSRPRNCQEVGRKYQEIHMYTNTHTHTHTFINGVQTSKGNPSRYVVRQSTAEELQPCWGGMQLSSYCEQLMKEVPLTPYLSQEDNWDSLVN